MNLILSLDSFARFLIPENMPDTNINTFCTIYLKLNDVFNLSRKILKKSISKIKKYLVESKNLRNFESLK